MIYFVSKMPQFQCFHTYASNFSFVSFTLNEKALYFKKGDHLALMVGFLANSWLSSTLISTNWIHTTIAQGLSTALVVYFFGYKQDNEFGLYEPYKIIPAFVLLVLSCGANSYYVEMNDKKQFFEKYQNSIL